MRPSALRESVRQDVRAPQHAGMLNGYLGLRAVFLDVRLGCLIRLMMGVSQMPVSRHRVISLHRARLTQSSREIRRSFAEFAGQYHTAFRQPRVTAFS